MNKFFRSSLFAISLFPVLMIASQSQAKELTFVGQDYPPFNWQEGSNVKGGMVEVIQKACEKMKHSCKFQIIPLARALKMLESGEVDAVMSLIPNPEREAYANFSSTVIASRMAYLGTKGKAPLSQLKELEGATVGVVRGSSSAKMVIKHKEHVPSLTIMEESDNETLVKKVQGNRYGDKGLIFGSEDVLKHFAQKSGTSIDTILPQETQNFMVAFSKSKVDADTLASFSKTFEEMKKNGEMKVVLDKYSLKTD